MFIIPKSWKSHREHTYKLGCRYSTGFYSVVRVVVVEAAAAAAVVVVVVVLVVVVVVVVVAVVAVVVVVGCTTSSGGSSSSSASTSSSGSSQRRSSSSSTYPMYHTEASVLGFPHRLSMYAPWKTSVLGFPHRFSMYAQCKTDQPKAFGDDMFGQCSKVKCTSDHNFKCTSDPNFQCTSDSSPTKKALGGTLKRSSFKSSIGATLCKRKFGGGGLKDEGWRSCDHAPADLQH